jgi:hypothetical protein
VATRKADTRKPKKRSKKVVRINARRVRKNMDMDPAKLAAVKEILGAPSETEAVDRAFDEIIFEHKVSAGLDKLKGTGGLPKVDPDA